MRDERDYFGSCASRCGECKHYEPLWIYSNAGPGVIGKTRRDRGECKRYGITVGEDTYCEDGCWEDE